MVPHEIYCLGHAQQAVEYHIPEEDVKEEIVVAGKIRDHVQRVKWELVLAWKKVHPAVPTRGETGGRSSGREVPQVGEKCRTV